MKKTFNINIAGVPFTIDDDAYTLLNDYIDTIEHAFANLEDYRELVADIESRIAELLLEQTSTGRPIITLAEVEDVIRRVGKPEEMVEEDENITISSEAGTSTVNETISEEETITPPPYVPPIKIQKKLFRDTQNSMLGGVCSGLAWYLNIDATWVRLLTVAAIVVSFATVAIAYIVLWIVVPEARSPLQRMQMMGEEPTMENIGKTVTDNFREDHRQQPVTPIAPNNTLSETISSVLGVIVKILTIIGLIIGIPVLIALGTALLVCLFALIAITTSLFTETVDIWGGMPVEPVKYLTMLGLGAIIVIGIPLSLLIRKGLKPKGNPMGGSAKWTLLGVWIAGFILAAVSSVFFVREIERFENNRHSRYRIENFSDKINRAVNRVSKKRDNVVERKLQNTWKRQRRTIQQKKDQKKPLGSGNKNLDKKKDTSTTTKNNDDHEKPSSKVAVVSTQQPVDSSGTASAVDLKKEPIDSIHK